MQKHFRPVALWWHKKTHGYNQPDQRLAPFFRHWGIRQPVIHTPPALWAKVLDSIFRLTGRLAMNAYTWLLPLATNFPSVREFFDWAKSLL